MNAFDLHDFMMDSYSKKILKNCWLNGDGFRERIMSYPCLLMKPQILLRLMSIDKRM
jgi:hypothetical protein